MAHLDALLNDLVIANRILANQDVVDAYGHVSVRHPEKPDRFFLARSLAPELVTRDDIVELTLDGKPVKEESVPSISNASSMEASSKCARKLWRWCTRMLKISCRLASPAPRP